MGNRERAEARAALKHALDALEDGAGHDVWGPGMVLTRLEGQSIVAALALEAAIVAVHYAKKLGTEVGLDERAQYTRHISKVAPVLLEIILEDDE